MRQALRHSMVRVQRPGNGRQVVAQSSKAIGGASKQTVRLLMTSREQTGHRASSVLKYTCLHAGLHTFMALADPMGRTSISPTSTTLFITRPPPTTPPPRQPLHSPAT